MTSTEASTSNCRETLGGAGGLPGAGSRLTLDVCDPSTLSTLELGCTSGRGPDGRRINVEARIRTRGVGVAAA